MNHKGDHAPYFTVGLLREFYGLIVRILGQQPHDAILLEQSLHREIAVDHCDDHLAARWLQGAVYHQNVVMVDAGADHGVPCHPHKEGSGRVLDHELVEIETALDIIIGRRRKAGGHPAGKQGPFEVDLSAKAVDGGNGGNDFHRDMFLSESV